MNLPGQYALSFRFGDSRIATYRDRFMDIVKVAFMLVLATWMTGCIMMVVYNREIAMFILERTQ